MYIKIAILAILIGTLFGAHSLHAETILRTGETVSISEDRAVVGDFYSLASITNISGQIEGDAIAAAGRLTINGEVSADVLAIGGSVDIHGPVGDDVRVVGGEVVIAEPVAGSVFVVGGSVSVLSSASIGGDLLIYGGDVEILGPVEGDVLGGYSSLRIDSTIAGNVDVSTDQLTLGENAELNGTLSYTSANLLERAPNAIVVGEIIRTDRVAERELRSLAEQYLSVVLILAFATLTWYLLGRKSLTIVTEKATVYSPRAALYGAAGLLLTPLLIAVLLTSMLGAIVGTFALLSYLLIILLAVASTPVTIGHIAERLSKQTEGPLSVATILIGLIITALLPLVPIFGPAAVVAVVVVNAGALIDSLVSSRK